MEKLNNATSKYSEAHVKPADAHHLNRTDLIGKRVTYRYHRQDFSYFGKILEMFKDRSVKVKFDSGDVVIRRLSSFNVK